MASDVNGATTPTSAEHVLIVHRELGVTNDAAGRCPIQRAHRPRARRDRRCRFPWDRGQVAKVWLCEVSTQTRGLGGYRGDAPGKIRTKNASVKAYADERFLGVERVIKVWSPKVGDAMRAKVA